GVNILVVGTSIGAITDVSGRYSVTVTDRNAMLRFSFIGYVTQEVALSGRSTVDVDLISEVTGLDEVIVVGYGTQKKSDITGTVASIGKERLEKAPNISVAQGIQGAIPGLMVQNTSAGAEPSLDIMVRGRNSIAANNSPLIVVDGIPYGGRLSDINPSDIESIEILKDASAAAIYGSRGSNGVILITTKQGMEGSPTITYDGYVSMQEFTNVPTYMDGPRFYDFKNERLAAGVTTSEQAIYDAGEWVNWADLATRQGFGQQHNLSISGGFGKTSYFVSGGVMNVKGIVINDDYLRSTGRFNLDSKIADWLTIGTRTQITFSDKSGVAPSMYDVYIMNPLAVPYNEDGTLTIQPVADDPARENPLQEIQFSNSDKSRRIVTNNYAIVDFSRLLPGLNFRLNYGVTDGVTRNNTYRGRDTYDGKNAQGSASIDKNIDFNTVLENILSYKTEFGAHSLFATAVYSIQSDEWQSEEIDMEKFPNDLLTWYAGGQAGLIKPSFNYIKSRLISQMFRLNYSYLSRYLLTLTVRRDGYSGFGADSKWGVFPSVALGWNLANENFFPFKDLFSQLKLRASYGLNGNQAVGSYRSMGRMKEENYLSGNTTMPGYFPSTLGQQTLGWESSRSFNFGLDFGILNQRITGDLNIYHTNTYDLLLNRTISSIHGITSILQNIGETQNQGIEFSVNSRNFVKQNFTWTTTGNISYLKNKILDLYGDELDDVGNSWFIGQPIRVNFNYVFDGVWQLDEAEEAAKWGSKPGYLKLKDVDNDSKITPADRQIIGRQDPNFLWGLTNTFTVKNFNLSIFLHGVHGITKQNVLMDDEIVTSGVRRNTIVKKWWTPENFSNEWYMNHVDANRMAGVTTNIYENASFVRVKDITLSYDFPNTLIRKIGGKRLTAYLTGRNLFTFTEWRGLDPELNDQRSIPLQREFVFGLQIGL
ncbi:MAG TPA: SusC/RagA family TonB-linked outer membrane protein, partial [Bacteroidales bacterium]|nr:SusC/RagA family TonB-linked outer membrane protein [Bacteroidales bacterium]